MPRIARTVRAALGAAFFVVLAAASALAGELYQVGTIEALLAGDYAGRETFATLARYGDCGLGTFSDLDGEMVALDGRFYQVKTDGRAYPVAPSQKTPFAQVTHCAGVLDLGRLDGLDLAGLGAALATRLPDPTRFYVVRVDGLFTSIRTRSVPAQQQPWPPLATACKAQAEFPMQEVAGTMVGVYTPPNVAALSPVGWHFHFLTTDRTRGGHVLAATVAVAKARGEQVTDLRVVFPAGPTPRMDGPRPAAGTE
ncbi:acetolactate decarboxylase [Solidesulfovibrio sp.]|uniref:acetolactate decarboxylase n=1 Tax=Solidesulfovibrio sp. TaxID=2910990 RepID=UPI002B21DFDF|nr:acetolactate decarboxylase [Solidesulfovibrio sp.]MEA5088781.1 acetolactate decarboxylase [Solidesulfovibrio sp.]